jgi:hypothetical protein
MDVVRHHTPGAERVPVSLKMEHCPLYERGDAAAPEDAAPDRRLWIMALDNIHRSLAIFDLSPAPEVIRHSIGEAERHEVRASLFG